MISSPTRCSLFLVLFALGCATTKPLLTPEPSALEPVSPAASLVPTSTKAMLDEEARWLKLSFFYADNVLRVRVLSTRVDGIVEAEVLEQWRGYQNAQPALFRGKLAGEVGSQWIVASSNLSGASPERVVFAALEDTEENIALAKTLYRPAWERSPLVAIVKIIEPPKHIDYERRALFEVVEVLRGTLPEKLIDNNWSSIFQREYTPLHPLTPGKQLYVLSAWSVHKNQYVPVEMPHISSLDPIEQKDISAIKAALATDPYSAERASLEAQTKSYNDLYQAWAVHLAPYVALTRITSTHEEATGCGGRHYLLAPVRWMRGETSALPTKSLPRTFDFGVPITPQPTLFYGGGHCYHGSETAGTQRLAAGHTLGGSPDVVMESNPTNEALFDTWMNAPKPLFSTLDPSLSTYSALKKSETILVPELPTLLPRHGWIRFQVIERKEIGSEVLLRCQELVSSGAKAPAEWVFYGEDLPSWGVGTTRWGLYINRIGQTGGEWFENKYFLPDFFLPADDEQIMRLFLNAANYFTDWQNPRP
jgi:hypothetical protein